MLIDCNACAMQHTPACDECVVTALLDRVAFESVELDAGQRRALRHLADAGLVPGLRLVPRHEDGPMAEAG